MDKDIKELMKLPLFELMKELGWNMAIPAGGGPADDGMVHGMIIGEEAYVNYVLKHLEL